MDENMNGNQQNGMNAGQPDGAAQNMNPNQQAYGGQQYYDPNQQAYGGQQYYDPNQQAYGGQQYYDPNQQAYGGQQYYDPNQQAYGGQQYYDPNQQAYGGQYGQQPQGNKPAGGGFDKVKNAIMDNKKIVLIAAAAVVALILIFNIIGGIASHGKQSPKAVIKAYVNAVEKQSGKKMYKLIDKKIIKYIKDENDIDKEDMIEQLDDVMEYSGEALENQVGKVKSIKVKFKKIKKLKGSKLEDKKEDYEDDYDIKVSQVARVEATIKVKGKDDDAEEDITMYVYKRAGKWYLDFSSVY
ncbi:MAG: hypothetical protein V8R54_06065 [Coprococcus sp.]|jgi:hypothetical protein|uniref:hypothetical protein n=1 Tax=Coprococcus sp. TaxID=2049024 RepID=UPI002EB7658C|nr:hypothetical protein [Coprococcus sp.]